MNSEIIKTKMSVQEDDAYRDLTDNSFAKFEDKERIKKRLIDLLSKFVSCKHVDLRNLSSMEIIDMLEAGLESKYGAVRDSVAVSEAPETHEDLLIKYESNMRENWEEKNYNTLFIEKLE